MLYIYTFKDGPKPTKIKLFMNIFCYRKSTAEKIYFYKILYILQLKSLIFEPLLRNKIVGKNQRYKFQYITARKCYKLTR